MAVVGLVTAGHYEVRPAGAPSERRVDHDLEATPDERFVEVKLPKGAGVLREIRRPKAADDVCAGGLREARDPISDQIPDLVPVVAGDPTEEPGRRLAVPGGRSTGPDPVGEDKVRWAGHAEIISPTSDSSAEPVRRPENAAASRGSPKDTSSRPRDRQLGFEATEGFGRGRGTGENCLLFLDCRNRQHSAADRLLIDLRHRARCALGLAPKLAVTLLRAQRGSQESAVDPSFVWAQPDRKIGKDRSPRRTFVAGARTDEFRGVGPLDKDVAWLQPKTSCSVNGRGAGVGKDGWRDSGDGDRFWVRCSNEGVVWVDAGHKARGDLLFLGGGNDASP